MSDLIKQLRTGDASWSLRERAADRIEALEAALETQRSNDQKFKNAYYDRAVKAESMLREMIDMQHQPEEYRLNSVERARVLLTAVQETDDE